MKSVYYLLVIVAISFLISLNTYRIFSIQDLSIFLTVIGLIYGLITAFSISNSWDKFSKIRDAISEETASLKSVYIYSKYLSDVDAASNIKRLIAEYCKEVPKIEWKDYFNSRQTHHKFEGLINIVAGIKIGTEKDKISYATIADELRDATSARNIQLIISQTRITAIQWILNIFLSLILVSGLALVSLPNYPLSIYVLSAMISSIIFILVVIYEMDSLKIAEKEVYINPYNEVVDLIGSDGK